MNTGATEFSSSKKNGGPLIDWRLAASTGAWLVKSGPSLPADEATQVVSELRVAAIEAETHVRQLTDLGHDLPIYPASVVDRPGWIRAAAQGLDALTGAAGASFDNPTGGGGRRIQEMLARSAGVQTGTVLAFLASRILGQYDPFSADTADKSSGRLLIVAPNVVAAQQAMNVSAQDFRMWVCLHESTHRLQFTAVPWLRDYFADQVRQLVSGVSQTNSAGLRNLVKQVAASSKSVTSKTTANSGSPDKDSGGMRLAELLQSPEQREVFDRIMALSTLLEGHADYVMDAVGPEVVPSVHEIRRRFTARRKGGSLIDRMLRGLLGVNAKVRQYAQGSAFTRQVIDQVGMDGFNAIWLSPENLPTRAEISQPSSWIHRVHQ